MPRKPLLSFFPPRSSLQETDTPTSPASPLPSSPQNSQNTGQRAPLSTIQNLKSPAFPPLFTATIPQMPYPWIWKCHLCGSVYRLGVTRRCLEDGHLFCSLPSPPSSPSTTSQSTTSLSSLFHALEQQKQQKRAQKKKRRKPKGCRAEFDYSGWETYNEWRREIRSIKYRIASPPLSLSHPHLHPQELGLRGGELDLWGERPEKEKQKLNDCWRDCDFPSECLNERVREREDARLRRVVEREREAARSLRASRASEEEGRDGDGDVAMSDSPTLDIEPSFYDGDSEEDLERDGRRGVDSEVLKDGENMGPVGTDSDGLGEEKLGLCASRRKSLDAGMETPRSPLKESFGFADVEVGGWGEMVGEKMEQVLL